DQPFKQMTGINIISERPLPWLLSEPLSYELYRMAGVPAEQTDHVRLLKDGKLLGYQLLVEQPNKSFIARHGRNDSGNLYKLLWYGQGVIGQHEKKTHVNTGHDDLVKLVNGLNKKSGDEQWKFIEENFNVDEVVNYFAVNMCIQNWDGFFNNYFAYHDTGKTGKWEMYPWDEDKTWGDYDGVSPKYDWYEMPLTFGMAGDQPPGGGVKSRLLGRFFQGPWGGPGWWRPPGYFSGPLLANPEFRKRFLARLDEICANIFTQQKMFPLIDAMEKRLTPEARLSAETRGEDATQAVENFRNDIQSLRNQVLNRRKFIQAELKRGN
ncbi:MAG: CotH kinase family protein, partial [Verrucomicrobia bacterium]|nr:CotH kinase family protein [Verrucomicrobiota bacterium]